MATIQVRTGLTATIEQQLEMLSPRDRKLLVGLVLCLSAAFVGGYWYLLNGLLDDKASQVRDAKSALAIVHQLDTEYRQHTAQFEAQRDRLQEHSAKSTSSWIEGLATEYGIIEQLRAVNELTVEPLSDVMKRETFRVELKRVPQEPLYRFLYALETDSYPASVESATFKVTYKKKEKFMDLTLELAVLSLVGEG
ncbi:MAG TPA: hypothetical protein ENK18_06305 [Deltaproteobacteria bacterium]|nr:hypothetical protein [Deltaproteobacteria bacterium]